MICLVGLLQIHVPRARPQHVPAHDPMIAVGMEKERALHAAIHRGEIEVLPVRTNFHRPEWIILLLVAIGKRVASRVAESKGWACVWRHVGGESGMRGGRAHA